ncbi:hypothetical protein AAFF_G00383440 [Aldrovandia affinis]|uniref:Fanconi anemia group A protein n=1 Tax=Aldrovandia affinis TaxID=143900 RepID=A0AAD7X0T5_9TELE|nr:hypothetical protein AAFF_G00383440 [Aldrovandia affinis]
MSVGTSDVSASAKKGTLSALLAARVGKRPRCASEQELQEAAIQLLNRNQNLLELLQEVRPLPRKVQCSGDLRDPPAAPPTLVAPPTPAAEGASLLACALHREAVRLGVPVGMLSARLVAERVHSVSGRSKGTLLNLAQRAQLTLLLQSTQELLSLGAFSPPLFCHELWSAQMQPQLEVVWSLHSGNIVSLENILDSEKGAGPWLGVELQALCGQTAAEEEEDVRWQILTGVASVLIRAGFQEPQDQGAPCRRITQVCRRVLDSMLSWVLDSESEAQKLQSTLRVAESWVQVFDVSVCSVFICSDVFLRFLTHSLTHTLTYRPRLKVSDAIAMQSAWSFAKTSHLLTSLYRKLSVLLSMDELLSHLQQVLETHEVNWQHVLSHLSTLLVYHPHAQRSVIELLSRLLRSAFEGYDMENMITAFLLARQGALESPAVFPPYSQWFRMSFGSASGYHGNSKKSLVFLLKFLSDLVPFEPPQYLKVHLLHPPFVPAKHRALLQEYVSLAKTRLADLQVSVEEMGLFEDVSEAGAPVQFQAGQDVEKAISLFESTGRISAAVMEASIFRKPYFLYRFLPALLTPRVLPDIADARMAFIESLRKVDKIPVSLYSTYTQSCGRERQRQLEGVGVELGDREPLERLLSELQELRSLVSACGGEQDVPAHLARVSELLRLSLPDKSDDSPGQSVVRLRPDMPTQSDLENKVVSMILRNFSQCLMDASRTNPPNRQGPWASQFVRMLLGHRQLLPALLHRMWDLLHNQGASLDAAHVLGLAAFVVHLYMFQSQCPLVEFCPTMLPCPMTLPEALSTALRCGTHADMSFCLWFCVAAVCYGICRGASSEHVQEYVPSSLFKKLLYLIPRLVPGTRAGSGPEGVGPGQAGAGPGLDGAWSGPEGVGPVLMLTEREAHLLWRNVTDPCTSWRSSACVLWRHAHFRALQTRPAYQLPFSEWLAAELTVRRSQDALSDTERWEYQQWACEQQYLSAPLDQGGCAGDVRSACAHIVTAVLELETGRVQMPFTRQLGADSCLPDILCRLQELLYELELPTVCGGGRGDGGHFLLDLIWEKCSVPGDLHTVSAELALQQALHTCNRVMMALPVTALITVQTQGSRRTLDCNTFMDHVNHRQRNACTPAGLLPFPLTAHFYRGVLSASVRCDQPSRAVNEALSQMHLRCPLLLVSAGGWWARLGPVLVSLWSRLSGDPQPEELLRLADCYTWACSKVRLDSRPHPSAPSLLLAACLHRMGREREGRSISPALGQQGQVLVFLLFFCLTDLLSALLQPQEKGVENAKGLCFEILTHLEDCDDWLLLFHPPGAEQGPYQVVTMVTTDRYLRLMPLAFYSVIPDLDSKVLGRLVKVPGFLLTALHCYSALTALFLDGHTPVPCPESSTSQVDPLQIVARARQVLLQTIAWSPDTHLSHSHRSQLQEACGELDPEVTAALSSYLAPPSPAHTLQESDFL